MAIVNPGGEPNDQALLHAPLELPPKWKYLNQSKEKALNNNAPIPSEYEAIELK